MASAPPNASAAPPAAPPGEPAPKRPRAVVDLTLSSDDEAPGAAASVAGEEAAAPPSEGAAAPPSEGAAAPPAAAVTQDDALACTPKKKKKAPRVSLACEDVLMAHVAPCLTYVELFALARATKALGARLTHEVALTSVLLNAANSWGKNAKTTIRDVFDLYRKSQIHEPSPMRLLRLANGKRCEFGPCSRGETNNVHKARPDWGIFACWPCTSGGGLSVEVPLRSKKANREWGAVVNDPRTAQHRMSAGTYLFRRPVTAAGEAVGPIVTIATREHSGQTPDAALVATFDRLDAAGVRRAREVADETAEKRKKAKAAKKDKIAEITASVRDLCSDAPGLFGSRVLMEGLNEFYNAPSKASKTRLRAVVEEAGALFGEARDALGGFESLDETKPSDALLKRAATELGDRDFYKFASRGVLEAARAGRLREAVFERLNLDYEKIEYGKRMSAQLNEFRAPLYAAYRDDRRRLEILFAAVEEPTRPRQMARTAWAQMTPGNEVLTLAKYTDEFVLAARAKYQDLCVAAAEIGARLDEAEELDPGTGEDRFYRSYTWLNQFLTDRSFERAREWYKRAGGYWFTG